MFLPLPHTLFLHGPAGTWGEKCQVLWLLPTRRKVIKTHRLRPGPLTEGLSVAFGLRWPTQPRQKTKSTQWKEVNEYKTQRDVKMIPSKSSGGSSYQSALSKPSCCSLPQWLAGVTTMTLGRIVGGGLHTSFWTSDVLSSFREIAGVESEQVPLSRQDGDSGIMCVFVCKLNQTNL